MPAPPLPPDRRRRLILGAGSAFALVLLLRGWLEVVGPLPGDQWSLRWTSWPPRPAPWNDVIAFFDLLGAPLIAAVTVTCVLVVVVRSDGLGAGAFVATACVGVAVNALLKVLLGSTPLWVAQRGEQGLNYPSGHTVYAVVLGGSLAWLALQHGRRDVAAILGGLIVVMGPTRVLGGAHLFSDVVAGYLMGGAWLVGTWLVLESRVPGIPGARPPVGPVQPSPDTA